MTDNEKAPTFIGWKPKEKQIGPQFYIDAPDMADPRHYMKALDSLPDLFIWEFGHHHGKRRLTIWKLREGNGHGIVARAVETSILSSILNLVPVKALAALYDAEYPDAHL